MENIDEVYEFYNAGAEIGRLERGLGKIELFRTKEILSSYVSGHDVIYDVGGGVGIYSAWLARQGNDVHLIELADKAVEFAKKNMMNDCSFIAEVGDARCINRPSNSADVVLLMGPLYHLQSKADREKALQESYRILKNGGLLICSGISKYSSTTWALSVYGEKNDFIDDPVFFNMLREEIITGNHNRPKKYPYLIAQSYFSTPSNMADEILNSGFSVVNKHAVEGCIWFTPLLEEKWEDEMCRKSLLDIIHMTENESEIIGMSPHFIVVGKK